MRTYLVIQTKCENGIRAHVEITTDNKNILSLVNDNVYAITAFTNLTKAYDNAELINYLQERMK